MVDVKDIKINFVSEHTGEELFTMGFMGDYSKDGRCPRVSDEKTYRFVVEDGLNPLDFQFLNLKNNKKNPLMCYPCNKCEHLNSAAVFKPESTDVMSIQIYKCNEYGGKRIAVGLAKGKRVTFSKERLEKLLEEKNTNIF
jgi:hypothetical protein